MSQNKTPSPKRLGFLNRYLTLWIFAAMFVGMGPLIEVPVLILPVNVALKQQKNFPVIH